MTHRTGLRSARTSAADWLHRPGNRSLVAALVVAFVLRVVWALWATRTPGIAFADPSKFLNAATDLANGHLPLLHSPGPDPLHSGRHSAGTAVGYPVVIAPFVWLAIHTGWLSAAFAVALFNVLLATLNVALAAKLAATWFSGRERNVTAWVLAVAPTQIYMVSVAMADTIYVTAVLAGLLLGGRLVRRAPERPVSTGGAALFGLFVGWAALVNPGGLLLVLVPALTVRARHGAWRGAFRGLGFVLAGALLVLGVWTVRNGTQVGVWTPMPTSNAQAVCTGHWDGATGNARAADEAGAEELIVRCFLHEPLRPGQSVDTALVDWLASDPDEAEWYYTNNREAISWALHHPLREVPLSALKVWETMRTDEDALHSVNEATVAPIMGPRTEDGLQNLANAWHYVVLALAGLALALLPKARRAIPIWAIAALNLLGVISLHGLPRYHHAIMPLLAVFAACAIVAIRGAASSSPEESTTEPSVVGAD